MENISKIKDDEFEIETIQNVTKKDIVLKAKRLKKELESLESSKLELQDTLTKIMEHITEEDLNDLSPVEKFIELNTA